MSQNLQNFVKFQKFQLDNLVDFFRKDRDCPVEKETPKRKGTSGREEAQPPPPDVEAWSSSQC